MSQCNRAFFSSIVEYATDRTGDSVMMFNWCQNSVSRRFECVDRAIGSGEAFINAVENAIGLVKLQPWWTWTTILAGWCVRQVIAKAAFGQRKCSYWASVRRDIESSCCSGCRQSSEKQFYNCHYSHFAKECEGKRFQARNYRNGMSRMWVHWRETGDAQLGCVMVSKLRSQNATEVDKRWRKRNLGPENLVD